MEFKSVIYKGYEITFHTVYDYSNNSWVRGEIREGIRLIWYKTGKTKEEVEWKAKNWINKVVML